MTGSYGSTSDVTRRTEQRESVQARHSKNRDAADANDADAEDHDELESPEKPVIGLGNKIRRWLKTPSVSHVLIVAVLGSLAGGVIMPVELPVLREFACDWHFRHKTNQSLVSSTFFSLFPSSRVAINVAKRECGIPVVAKLAGEIITAARILNATVTVLCLTIYSDLLSRYGRKPMFAFTAFCLTLSAAFFGLGAHVRGNAGIALITGSFALTGLGSQPLLQLTFQSYIVECVKMEERAPAFSRLGSATFAGLAIAALASAGLTEFVTSMPLLPYWVGTAIFAFMCLYCLFILPEALTAERQEELVHANEELHNYGPPSGRASPQGNTSESSHQSDAKWLAFLKHLNFLKKLGIFLPTYDEEKKRRDYRLFFLAIAFTIYRIGSMYMNDLLLLTTTASFGFGGVDNGLLISFLTACKAILLMGILPILIRYGRTKYVTWLAQRSSVHPPMEGLSESSRLLSHPDGRSANDVEADQDKAIAEADGSERFDLYFGGVSFIIDAIAFVAIGLSRTKWQLYASSALLSISAAGGPSAQAVATEVTAKALSDQVLGALSLIDETGAILSPLVIGTIYSASTESMPSLAWFVAACLVILSSLIMLGTASIRW